MLVKIAKEVLKNINPAHLVTAELKKHSFAKYEKIFVVGTGKGASKMAEAVEKNLEITEGFITIPEGETPPKLKKIKYINASHPLPNKNGIKGAKEILKIAQEAGKKDLVISLISGGGSALMPLPIKGISLEEKIKITSALLKSGATIQEINTIRKHLSQIKGGFLAKALYPATCLNLVISDVLGDDLSSIASGPLSPDPTTCEDAIKIFQKYKIPLPKQQLVETPKPSDKFFKNIKSKILANHETAAKTAEKIIKRKKLKPIILDANLKGECRVKAKETALKITKKNAIYILTGETTVTVEGKGAGGRNQEFVLAGIMANPKIELLSIGTDGVDGICPEKIAGAVANHSTLEKGINPLPYLQNNDSYHFFKKTGGLIKTGPTGTNLGDLVLGRINR